MEKTVGDSTVLDWGGWVYVCPSSCRHYTKAKEDNLPRALLHQGEHGWSGTAYSCGKYSSALSAETKEEAIKKATDAVNQALEERKKS